MAIRGARRRAARLDDFDLVEAAGDLFARLRRQPLVVASAPAAASAATALGGHGNPDEADRRHDH
jgi:hypothetical protein